MPPADSTNNATAPNHHRLRYGLSDLIVFVPVAAMAAAYLSERFAVAFFALFVMAFASLFVAIIQERQQDLRLPFLVSVWSALGAVVAWLAGTIMMLYGRSYPSLYHAVLPCTGAIMIVSTVYAARRLGWYYLWILIGQVVGLHFGSQAYSMSTHRDPMPGRLSALTIWCTATTIGFAFMAVLFDRKPHHAYEDIEPTTDCDP